ncbi:MAG: DUF305 domain-containing protein [Microlunatus sp.]|jgi:uncharacterized protein (DUF305 family)|nr:DUF305 domain-containing protein [Microlunatus sp.]MDN5803866.1 DUF305 domain-containing protein [Microlunatus sp.]
MPSRITLRTTLAVAAALAVTGLAGCSNNDMSNMPGMNHGSSGNPTTSSSPAASATTAAGPHNDADVMFAQAMIPHHQQAVAMSDMILAKDGIDAEVTDLATQIKAAQAPEIAQMSGWLAGWGENPSPSMGMDHDMGGGMMSQADMDALDQASGKDATRLFLTGMVTHHKGAITMAQEEVANGENPEAIALAKKIIADQQAEIDTMNQLLEQL